MAGKQKKRRTHSLLVTGGAGFIGSHFVRYLLEKEPDVRVVTLDALTYAGSRANLDGLPGGDRHTFIRGDICDGALVYRLMCDHGVDTVVHFAAESHVDRSITGPADFIRTNVTGTGVLLEAARRCWLDEKRVPVETVRFHQVSTDEVFGSLEPDDPAWNESSPYRPNSPYAASKAAADHLVRAWGHTYGLPFTISVCSNNYGPRQFPEKLLPLMVANALDGRDLPVYGDGGQIRDWLYVTDHCDALYRILTSGQAGQTYCIGGGVQMTNQAVVQMVCEILDGIAPDSVHCPHERLITFVDDRPGHDRRYALDTAKIERDLSWRPTTGFARGLEKTVRWYVDNRSWVESVRSGESYRAWMHLRYPQKEKR